MNISARNGGHSATRQLRARMISDSPTVTEDRAVTMEARILVTVAKTQKTINKSQTEEEQGN